MTTLNELAAIYDRFFALGGPPEWDQARPWRYRRRITSLGWPAAAYLGSLVETYRPGRILDLGSGLTTHILRSLSADVWTTDTSPGWLLKTVAELQRDGRATDRCFLHETFAQSPAAAERFDLISVDIADTAFRRSLAPQLARWLAPGGRMVLDDWHMDAYREGMTVALVAAGMLVEPQRETTDEFGRYVALATWEADRVPA